MKVLSISRHGREIASAALTSPMTLVGRSPSCDVVLRARGLQPVHFLLEWMGPGSFEADDGQWAIFDVSVTATGSEGESRKKIVGEGQVLAEASVAIGDFEFKWKVDRLMRAPLEGGALVKSFLEKKSEDANATGIAAGGYQLELVTIREDSGSVSHVSHLDAPSGRDRRIHVWHCPQLKVEWGGARRDDPISPVRIDLSLMPDATVLNRGQMLRDEAGRAPTNLVMHQGDLIQIRWNFFDHYFRLVPKIDVPPVDYALLKDAFYRITLLGLLLTVLAMALLRVSSPRIVEKVAEPPRIAKIEVRRSAQQPVAEASPPPVAPPPQEPEEKKAAPAVESANPGVGNGVAVKGNATSVGLLAALKPQKTAKAKLDRVVEPPGQSAQLSGKEANIRVQQPPSTFRDEKDAPNPGLKAAYSNVGVKDAATEKELPLAISPQPSNEGASYSQSAQTEEEFSAAGGLDKESVRRALAAYRKDVRTCYEKALLAMPKIKGRAVYKWQIRADGSVQWIENVSSTLNSPSLVGCVRELLKGIAFPKAANQRPTIVIYPFEFQTKN